MAAPHFLLKGGDVGIVRSIKFRGNHGRIQAYFIISGPRSAFHPQAKARVGLRFFDKSSARFFNSTRLAQGCQSFVGHAGLAGAAAHFNFNGVPQQRIGNPLLGPSALASSLALSPSPARKL